MSNINPREWAVRAQRNWIADHGNTLGGYMAHYAALTDNPVYTPEQVRAIYEADLAYLHKLESEVLA